MIHPPTILTDLSSSKNIFHDAIPLYKEALQKIGFTSDLVYTPKQFNHSNNNEENKKQRRKIIWFNPPFSKSVISNIGKTFLNLIKKYFSKTNKLHKTPLKWVIVVWVICLPRFLLIEKKKIFSKIITN